MASMNKDKSGRYVIQLVGADGKRRSIRTGFTNKKTASEVKLKVEHLHALNVAKLPMDAETAAWVGGIGDELADKLAAVGLVPARESRMLGEFLNTYIQRRCSDTKGSTITNLNTVRNDLVAYFGADSALRSITKEQALDFRVHYQTRLPKLADATVYRRLKTVCMFFTNAKALELCNENPFANVKSRNANPAERQHYISPEDTEKMIDVAAPAWRTIIALARYAGLRCPSEVLTLTWENVDLARGRMIVKSPKTEHLEGKATRVVPIFANLRQHLVAAFELAPVGEVYVIGGKTGEVYRATSLKPGGWNNTNMRTTFEKIIFRAGLVEWPRLFHNLRASCETDLMQNHPIHVVTAWVGNTPKIALGHYLQTLDADFTKAIQGPNKSGANSGAVVVQNAVQSVSGGKSPEKTNATFALENKDKSRVVSDSVALCTNVQMGPLGFEPRTKGL